MSLAPQRILPDQADLHSDQPAGKPRLPIRSALVFVAFCGVSGILLGGLWHLLVKLPFFTVSNGGVASIGETEMSHFFDADAMFCLIGGLAGLAIGILGWRIFKSRGMFALILVLVSISVCVLLCWIIGTAIGPNNFPDRISAANPGDRVLIDFKLRSWNAVLVWYLFALIPVMLGAAFSKPAAKN